MKAHLHRQPSFRGGAKHRTRNLEIPGLVLLLLHHKFRRDVFLTIEAAQHGHRDMVLTSATINRRRMVATELGM